MNYSFSVSVSVIVFREPLGFSTYAFVCIPPQNHPITMVSQIQDLIIVFLASHNKSKIFSEAFVEADF